MGLLGRLFPPVQRRPRYFKHGQAVEIFAADHGTLFRARQVWVPGKIVRRLRKGEDLPFETSGWEPIASWYLVQFDADGALAWVRKIDMRLPGGPSYDDVVC